MEDILTTKISSIFLLVLFILYYVANLLRAYMITKNATIPSTVNSILKLLGSGVLIDAYYAAEKAGGTQAEKRETAAGFIKDVAKSRGIEIKDAAANFAVEYVVNLVKEGAEKAISKLTKQYPEPSK